MRFPDVAALLEIASEVTGQHETILTRRARIDLIVAALSRPFNEVAGVEMYPTLPEKLAAAVEHLVRRRPFPDRNREIALALAAVVFSDRGYNCPGLLNDSTINELRSLLISVEQGRAGMSELVRWFGNHTVSPTSDSALEPELKPWIYIGHPISRVQPERRSTIDNLARSLKEAIPAVSRYLGLAWEPSVYIPGELSLKNIYNRDSETMLESAAGFIYLEHEPSSGGGLNFAWAASLSLPILHLHPRGTSSELLDEVPANVFEDTYDNDSDVVIGAYEWLKQNHRLIADQGRRQRNLDVLYLPLWCAISNRWRSLNEQARIDAAATSGLDVRRVQQLLRNPRTLRAASGIETITLCSALGLDMGRWLTGRASGGLARGRPIIPPASLAERQRAFARLGINSTDQVLFNSWFDRQLTGVGARAPASRDDWIVVVRRWQVGKR